MKKLTSDERHIWFMTYSVMFQDCRSGSHSAKVAYEAVVQFRAASPDIDEAMAMLEDVRGDSFY